MTATWDEFERLELTVGVITEVEDLGERNQDMELSPSSSCAPLRRAANHEGLRATTTERPTPIGAEGFPQ
jgi:hypothetical protein